MSEVRVRENETLDSALRRFKRQCAMSGIMSEVRKREHYDKPSVRRKKKAEAARRKNAMDFSVNSMNLLLEMMLFNRLLVVQLSIIVTVAVLSQIRHSQKVPLL